MSFEVTYDDGRKVVATARPKDFVAFERQYTRSVSSFDKTAPMEWLCYLAWAGLHRTGQEPAGFDGFLDVVDDVTPVDEETPAAASDPSPTTPSPDESAP